MKSNLSEVRLPLSKSLRNREWILRLISENALPPCDVSEESEDSLKLYDALQDLLSEKRTTFDCGNAGTVARFLLALLATRSGEWQLVGSARLYERPMRELIHALRSLGAEIVCLQKEGYLPVRIQGVKLHGGVLNMMHRQSSQFVSALMLIGGELSEPLTLLTQYPFVSQPYIDLTVAMVNRFGGNIVHYSKGYFITPSSLHVPLSCLHERDWSSASYFYGVSALNPQGNIFFPDLMLDSLQGDRIVADRFAELGVATHEIPGGIVIEPQPIHATRFVCNFSKYPDLVPTFAVVLSLLHIPSLLTGVESLVYKESDRLSVLLEGLTALGYEAYYDNGLVLQPTYPPTDLPVTINTRNDHRMVMAFAMAKYRHPNLELTHRASVAKSFPSFWDYAALFNWNE